MNEIDYDEGSPVHSAFHPSFSVVIYYDNIEFLGEGETKDVISPCIPLFMRPPAYGWNIWRKI